VAREHDDAALMRELEGLKADHARLNEERVRVEQDLANLNRQIADLEASARAEYDTADPAGLAALLVIGEVAALADALHWFGAAPQGLQPATLAAAA